MERDLQILVKVRIKMANRKYLVMRNRKKAKCRPKE